MSNNLTTSTESTIATTSVGTTTTSAVDSPPDDPYEISCIIPDGITISRTKYGLGIFTTRDYLPNEVLYTGVYYNLPDFGYDRPLLLKTNRGNYSMTTEMHTVGIGHGSEMKQRQLFTFDSFMNHSCSPNTYSADEIETSFGGTYKTVALRHIPAGEQITCDYDLFEYDSRNKGIEKCECGADNCRGASLGFSYLPFDAQLNLLNRAYPEVIQSWLLHNPNYLYRQVTVPSGFAYCQIGTDLHLIATRIYHTGDLLHTYSTEYFDSTIYDTVILNVETIVYDENYQIINSNGGSNDSTVTISSTTGALPSSSTSTTATTTTSTGTLNKKNNPKSRGCNAENEEEEDDDEDRVSIVSANSHDDQPQQQPLHDLDDINPTIILENEMKNTTSDIISREMWYEPTRIVKKLDLLVHTVNRDNNIRELFGWDTFCNHSCEPNADFEYVNGSLNLTQTRARKDIQIGEMITCDYTLFDTELDGTEFICQCGAPSCKGIIKG